MQHVARQHSMTRHDGAATRADAHELARTAGRAVAMVAALRRLRQRRRLDRHPERTDQPPEKG